MMKFDQKYTKEHFIHFLGDFLPEDFQEKEEDIVIKKDRYKEIIKAKILGFSESLDLHVLEMDHTRENDPRIAIATDAFKILADHWIHQALVVFKNKESENYRLSYLTISLDLNDKNKAVKRYSNARRYSFYLGSHAKVKTPEQQLIKKGRVKDIADLSSRFSVEVVNKQFYLEIAKHFDELVATSGNNLSLPGVSQEDQNMRKSFAVRLIGRLMFCWFLKQKKSDSGQLIPDALLSTKAVVDDYYHSTLEPLFFEVLNTNIESRAIRSDLFDKVPYLNGGLFNPQSDDYYELDRGVFASKYINTLKISDTWFKNFFELLETYNFTIDENTVFDLELSVDPEMLGRIFENLLAEINPDTGSSERKRTGSFYTPRQIVEYMVDRSLTDYLKSKTKIDAAKIEALVSYDLNDDTEYPFTENEKVEIIHAIDTLKILDPSCGSGAYPIGALQKIVYILQTVDPDCRLWLDQKLKGVPELYKQKIVNEVKSNPFDYTRKLDVIKNSIFGVDIQPIAVDVSRLRCFLTLMVESEIDDAKQNRGIEPLPNLDFKFVCANTLVSLPRSEATSLFDDHSGIIELSGIMSEYFSCNSQRKNEIKLRFINAQKSILEKTVSLFGKNTGNLTMLLTMWNPFGNTSNSWFDPEWMFGLQEKFDVVIGNPPYLESRHPSFSPETKEIIQQSVKERRGANSIYITNGADLLIYFYERGLGLIKDDGYVVYIVQNSWLDTDYGKKFQQFLLAHTRVKSIIDSDLKHFEGPNINTVITVFNGNTPDENDEIVFSRFGTQNIELHRIPYSHPLISKIKWGVLLVSSEKVLNLLEIIEKKGKLLQDIGMSVGQGLNLTKDYIFDKSILDRFNFLKNSLVPFMTTEDGAPFELKTTESYLINAANLDEKSMNILKDEDIKVFNSNATNKVPPLLILPRGVSRHFCALNSINAYTASSVEIYGDNLEEEKIMNLWCFLNSSIAWILREATGRKNLGGGLLKAEATDVKSMPIYFNFNAEGDIKKIYEQIKERQALPTLEEIDSPEHKAIDDIVFKHLGISEDKKTELVDELKEIIRRRSAKSKT